MRYAIIENDQVANVAEANAPIAENWVPSETAGIGWAYAGGVFTAPEAPPAPEPIPEIKYLSKLGFRNRFTMAEKAALEIASLDDPTASMPARMVAATLRASLADQRDATYIDPLRSDTRAGAIQLETYGVIAAGRALEILDAPIQDGERYFG